MKKYYSTSVSFFKLLPIFFILFLSFVAFSIAGNPTTITENVDLQITLSMSKHSGDNQYAAIQTALDDPFVVQVIDKKGNGVIKASIKFAIDTQPSGAIGAKLSVENAITDDDGYAETILTTGNKGGIYTVCATTNDTEVKSGSPVTFSSTGIKVEMGKLYRVPMCDATNKSKNDKPIKITIIPNPLPTGATVDLEIVRVGTGGTGDATFDNGNKKLQISKDTTVKIRGVANSSEKDNMKIVAKVRTKECADDLFSVRTWPETGTFLQNHVQITQPHGGALIFFYSVKSESKDIRDLYGKNEIGEWVDYPGNGPMYEYPSPPYRTGILGIRYWTYDPHEDYKKIGKDIFTAAKPLFSDTHEVPTTDVVPNTPYNPFEGFSSKYENHVEIVTQKYYFRDLVLQDGMLLLGPLYIRRNVYFDSGVWKYRIEKDGFSDVIILP